ncbi:MAG: hypothetical protein Q7U32_09545, partial [Rhodocyclaceae bacterium]|nr:hypothetical protein [Rhodocyclaceae bacterium]
MEILILLVVVGLGVGVGYLVLKRRGGNGEAEFDLGSIDIPVTLGPDGKRIRLTDNQIGCLCCADFDTPIYAENPSLMHAQMPNGAKCFPLRTVQSLVRRGYLRDDGRGGYLMTDDGMLALRSGMG